MPRDSLFAKNGLFNTLSKIRDKEKKESYRRNIETQEKLDQFY